MEISAEATAAIDRVQAVFESQQVPFVEQLVNAPSHTLARQDVEQAAQLIDAKAEAMGLRTSRHADATGTFADHRVYQTPAAVRSQSALLLVGHVDTVFPRSTKFLSYRRQGQRIFGPGCLDMKSGLSSILFALDAVRLGAPRRYQELSIRIVVVSDEEVGSPSSAGLHRELAREAYGALVFEAGRVGDRIVTARKGAAAYRVDVEGVAAHAGNQHRAGRSAIHALALLIPQLESLTNYDRGITVNVGTVTGGTAKNTVPGSATCMVDVRFERAQDAEAIATSFTDIANHGLRHGPEKIRDLKVRLHGGVSRPPMESSGAVQALRGAYEPFAAAQGLQVGEAPRQGGGSDANLLAAAGVPTIDGLGPYGEHFHSTNEWACLTSLRRRTRALAAFLCDGQTQLRRNSAA